MTAPDSGCGPHLPPLSAASAPGHESRWTHGGNPPLLRFAEALRAFYRQADLPSERIERGVLVVLRTPADGVGA